MNDEQTKSPMKVRSMAAQLFMGGFARQSSNAIICSSQPPISACGSASCAGECDEPIAKSCASGKSCIFDCDDAQDNIMVSVADDAESDDGVFDNIGNMTITDNNSYASDSSEEDMKDAFEGFGEAPESTTKPSKKIVESQDFKTFVKNDKLKREKTEVKKNTRQKGDADSLKKYAYGKFICVFLFNKGNKFGVIILPCRLNADGPWKNSR